MTSVFSWQNSISLCPASFHIWRLNLPVTQGVSWLPTFAFQSTIMKRTSFLGHFQFSLIHWPNTSGSYAIMFITVSDFTSIASHIHKLVGFFFLLLLFLLTYFLFFFWLWPSLFFLLEHVGLLSTWGVRLSVSYLFAFLYCSWSSQCKNIKWFSIPFFSGPHFVITLHHDPSILGVPIQHGS